jgi:hypothetical protein
MISCGVVSSGSAGQEVSLRFLCLNDHYDKHKTKWPTIIISDFITRLVYELYRNVLCMSNIFIAAVCSAYVYMFAAECLHAVLTKYHSVLRFLLNDILYIIFGY